MSFVSTLKQVAPLNYIIKNREEIISISKNYQADNPDLWQNLLELQRIKKMEEEKMEERLNGKDPTGEEYQEARTQIQRLMKELERKPVISQ
tara:strand:- start:917 stop:1192 length:276 start_codon:yes stop_codon:yes gene_type:complete